MQIKVIEKCCKVIEGAKCVLRVSGSSFQGRDADTKGCRAHTGRGAHNGCGTLGLACGTHPQRPETVPNCFKFPLKPLKSIGRLYIMACSSDFVNVMVVHGYD